MGRRADRNEEKKKKPSIGVSHPFVNDRERVACNNQTNRTNPIFGRCGPSSFLCVGMLQSKGAVQPGPVSRSCKPQASPRSQETQQTRSLPVDLFLTKVGLQKWRQGMGRGK